MREFVVEGARDLFAQLRFVLDVALEVALEQQDPRRLRRQRTLEAHLVEGAADATSSILKVFAGRWSDRLGARKPIVVAGYALSSLVRPFIALATSWTHVFAIRVTDRVGNTDEFGYRSVENVVTVHDLHATMLHLCGVNHERFSFKFQGLDAKLTGVEPARVVKDVLA